MDLSLIELFAGAGMVRAAIDGLPVTVTFANDICPTKAASYRANWGDAELHVSDIATVKPSMIKGSPSVMWASSPCQDLSLAGNGAGFTAARSGAIWPTLDLLESLHGETRAPAIFCWENVPGALTAANAAGIASIADRLAAMGYAFGIVAIDAAEFLPQSRLRVFMVAIRSDLAAHVAQDEPGEFHSPLIVSTFNRLPVAIQRHWRWWRLPKPAARNVTLAAVLEPDGSVTWDDPSKTAAILSAMAPLHRTKLATVQNSGARTIGTFYRRTRIDKNGKKAPTYEVRFDGLAGCLRTAAGGSSVQRLIVIDKGATRTRKMTAREAARLMGLSDAYILPSRSTVAYSLAGDGVAVPVVRHLFERLILPALNGAKGAAPVVVLRGAA
jgi:DNA (cytosine-5)-methyltransferase 1